MDSAASAQKSGQSIQPLTNSSHVLQIKWKQLELALHHAINLEWQLKLVTQVHHQWYQLM